MPTDAEGNEVAMGPGLFRKKPLTVAAMRFDGTKDGAALISRAFDSEAPFGVPRLVFEPRPEGAEYGVLKVKTLEGWVEAAQDTMVIRGIFGELYPCDPDVFARSYERVR